MRGNAPAVLFMEWSSPLNSQSVSLCSWNPVLEVISLIFPRTHMRVSRCADGAIDTYRESVVTTS